MILCNLRPKNGHVNGGRYTVGYMNENIFSFALQWEVTNRISFCLLQVSCNSVDDEFVVCRFRRTHFQGPVFFALSIINVQKQSAPDALDRGLRHCRNLVTHKEENVPKPWLVNH